MAIKADRWIQEMALQHGMIEPFVADQVRQGAISYGLSSYGYDMRIADEFKVFTNVFNTLVDPKHFDPRSFVDIKHDYCDIPPNSFVLARSVEYFRIPRRVLSVVLGKCLTGDTRVVDATTGAYKPISDMISDGSTIGFVGGRLKAMPNYAVISQGIKPVYRLRLRSGREIRATTNHPFLTVGGWAQLDSLNPGTRIAVARTIPIFGSTDIPDWEATLLGLMISEGQCSTPGHSPTYTSADPAMIDVLRWCVAEGSLGAVTYRGRYGYRLVNQVGRGGIVTKNRATTWLQSYRLDVKATAKFVPQAIFTAPKESVVLFLRALFTGDGSVYAQQRSICVEYASSSRRLIEDVHHLLLRFGLSGIITERHPKKGQTAWTITLHNKTQIETFAREIGFWSGSIKQQTLDSFASLLQNIELQRSKGDALPTELWSFARQQLGSQSYRSIGLTSMDTAKKMSYSQAAVLVEATHDAWISEMASSDLLWDFVEHIEAAGSEEVFDICVPEAHNFVANGIVVHNSTYARCFSGATQVALLDGTSASLEDLAEQWERGVAQWGYSVGPHGRIIATLLEQPRYIGRDLLLEITLDNGRTIRCTPDHEFLLRDGTLAQAQLLRPGSSLMPLYTELFRGYEGVYQPLTGHYTPTHRLADDWNIQHEVYETLPQSHRHHIDHNRRNNMPWNIMRVPAGEHLSYHNSANYGNPVYLNHKVVAIRELAGIHDVFCLTVPEAGNFALDAGVFVKNCGLIVNVTPLEPAWEGFVTIEVSNTTPLPARVYANEGIAQVLFFESDEDCMVSYADKAGKYQGQVGVVPPRMG
jgi:deoxycytidine triphosphate deaminase/intein/homing endonuclease